MLSLHVSAPISHQFTELKRYLQSAQILRESWSPYEVTCLNDPQSKACQTASWKSTHKNTCVPRKTLSTVEASASPEELYHLEQEKALTRWMTVWNKILETYTMNILDLANHPRDRNNTHWQVNNLGARYMLTAWRSMLVFIKRTTSSVDHKLFEVRVLNEVHYIGSTQLSGPRRQS